MTLTEMLDTFVGETSRSTVAKQFMASEIGRALLNQCGPAVTLFISGLDLGLEITKRYGRPSDEEEFETIYAPKPAEYRFGQGGRA